MVLLKTTVDFPSTWVCQIEDFEFAMWFLRVGGDYVFATFLEGYFLLHKRWGASNRLDKRYLNWP